MARKTIVELLAEIGTMFPDNNTGAITPAIQRAFLTDLVDTYTPAYGAISIETGVARTFNITPSLLVWSTNYIAQSPEWTADAPTGKITRAQAVITNRISVNVDVELPANRELIATLYKNGVATTWRTKISGSGAGRPAVLSLEAIDYNATQAEYQLYCQCDADGVACTFSNGIFLGSVVPVRTA